MLKDQLNADFKAAMLSKDKIRTEVLRGLKSAILYEEVAKGARETGLDETSLQAVIAREAKKRADTAALYQQANETERANKELEEKAIIDNYLPKQLSDQELEAIVAEIVATMPGAQMGQIIGAVRQKVGTQADGGRIAAAVKTKL